MSEDIIKNQFVEPSLKKILDYMNNYTRENCIKIANFLTDEYNAAPVVRYSKCSAMPGWNIKYKKGSKSFCTIYPDREYFTILLIIRELEINKIMQQKDVYSKYFLDIIKNSGSMNGCKWLMIGVDDSKVIEDIKRAINLKNNR
ncbi:MAG: hypothetical protein K0R72_31 [Clostridia bacterium]|jgi:hypothetical protein|nr:hypothetical protein [Clostridia bacterium]